MSKSQMNGVAPEVVFEKYGADVLRLWVCSPLTISTTLKSAIRSLEQVSTSAIGLLRNTSSSTSHWGTSMTSTLF